MHGGAWFSEKGDGSHSGHSYVSRTLEREPRTNVPGKMRKQPRRESVQTGAWLGLGRDPEVSIYHN